MGAFLLILSLFCSVYAQQTQQDQQKMVEAYMKIMAVNENHEYFKDFVGDWIVSTKAWMMPGAEPSISEGTSKGELIMGGRFLKMHFKSSMFGMPFEGLQIIGYDNLKKKYVIFWIGNASTAFYLSEGTRNESGKVLTDWGESENPLTGKIEKARGVTTLINKDEFVYEMFMVGPDGKEYKSLENRAKRKKV
jgi:hypothetical protein